MFSVHCGLTNCFQRCRPFIRPTPLSTKKSMFPALLLFVICCLQTPQLCALTNTIHLSHPHTPCSPFPLSNHNHSPQLHMHLPLAASPLPTRSNSNKWWLHPVLFVMPKFPHFTIPLRTKRLASLMYLVQEFLRWIGGVFHQRKMAKLFADIGIFAQRQVLLS